MNVEIFAICDAATASGKLSLVGVFDAIMSATEPVTHNACTLAVRMRFEKIEEGKKELRIAIVDIDGNEVFPTLRTNIEVQVRPTVSSATVQIVVQIQQLKLPRFGEYQIDLAIDGRVEKSIPLFARKRSASPNPPNA